MSKVSFGLEGKTILVTGASRGIGRSIAEAFRDAGANVYGTGTRTESIQWMQDGGVQGRVLNVQEFEAGKELIQEIVKQHGSLDCLVNNAGVSSNTPASGFKEDEVNKIMDTNFKALFFLCQAYYKAQRKQGGNIINVASVLGMVATMLASVYCGTKGAVLQLTRALALEWAGSNFRVNAICPGFIDTDMTAGIKAKDNLMQQMNAQIPMKRMGNPQDLAGAALFLASDLSGYMTGQSMVIDGGYTIH
ncbi:MAG: short-chain dehydrogenase [Leptospiraceae bacterium]|nr:short-chain dehydrogenase [Leptospiraceae bacterium]